MKREAARKKYKSHIAAIIIMALFLMYIIRVNE